MNMLETIKHYRAKKGIRQLEMAELLNVDISTYSRYERGERAFSIDQLPILSKALGISIAELFGEDVNTGFVAEPKASYGSGRKLKVTINIEIEPEEVQLYNLRELILKNL